MHYLVPEPTPCPEVVAVFYIRPAEVPTLFSVEGDAQVEQQNTVVVFLTVIIPSLFYVLSAFHILRGLSETFGRIPILATKLGCMKLSVAPESTRVFLSAVK